MALQKEMRGVRGGGGGGGGGGVFICHPDYTTSFCLPACDKNPNYRAELWALAAATEHVLGEGSRHKCMVFLADLLSALQLVASGPVDLLTIRLRNRLSSLGSHNTGATLDPCPR